MIVTEEAAKSLWCPFSRVIFNAQDKDAKTHGAASFNRTSDGCAHNKCLGSGCMAWEWHDEERHLGRCGFVHA